MSSLTCSRSVTRFRRDRNLSLFWSHGPLTVGQQSAHRPRKTSLRLLSLSCVDGTLRPLITADVHRCAAGTLSLHYIGDRCCHRRFVFDASRHHGLSLQTLGLSVAHHFCYSVFVNFLVIGCICRLFSQLYFLEIFINCLCDLILRVSVDTFNDTRLCLYSAI